MTAAWDYYCCPTLELSAFCGLLSIQLHCAQRYQPSNIRGFIDSNINLQYLLAEINSLVVEYLVKSNLKTLRHVRKAWKANATILLFDRAYILPPGKDLQDFAKIAHDPILMCSIKELIF